MTKHFGLFFLRHGVIVTTHVSCSQNILEMPLRPELRLGPVGDLTALLRSVGVGWGAENAGPMMSRLRGQKCGTVKCGIWKSRTEKCRTENSWVENAGSEKGRVPSSLSSFPSPLSYIRFQFCIFSRAFSGPVFSYSGNLVLHFPVVSVGLVSIWSLVSPSFSGPAFSVDPDRLVGFGKAACRGQEREYREEETELCPPWLFLVIV